MTKYDDSMWIGMRKRSNKTDVPGPPPTDEQRAAVEYSIEQVDSHTLGVALLSYSSNLGEFYGYAARNHPEVHVDVAPWPSMRGTPLVRIFGQWVLTETEARRIANRCREKPSPFRKYRG